MNIEQRLKKLEETVGIKESEELTYEINVAEAYKLSRQDPNYRYLTELGYTTNSEVHFGPRLSSPKWALYTFNYWLQLPS